MNEVYIVLQIEGVKPVVCDVWSSLPEAQAELDEIIRENKLSPIMWDSGGLKNELGGTIALASNDTCSVQIFRRTVHENIWHKRDEAEGGAKMSPFLKQDEPKGQQQ